jgi:hypothetical protein
MKEVIIRPLRNTVEQLSKPPQCRAFSSLVRAIYDVETFFAFAEVEQCFIERPECNEIKLKDLH